MEVGPGCVLSDLARANLPPAAGGRCITTLAGKGAHDPNVSLLRAAGAVWTWGGEVDLAKATELEGNLVSLPGYAFARERHWIDASADRAADQAPRAVTGARPAPMLLTPTWRREARPATPGEPLAAKRRHWLVFSDGPFGDALVGFLRRNGQVASVVRPGGGYRRIARGEYEIEATNADDYRSLLQDLRARVLTPRLIVHAWGLAGEGTGQAAKHAFHAPVKLAAALSAERIVQQIKVLLLSAGVYDVTGGEELRPDLALVSGPGLTLEAENAFLQCRYRDLDPMDLVEPHHEASARFVVQEILEAQAPRRAALRHGLSWTADLRPVAPKDISPFKPGGVYLITGGLGGVGLAIAKDLSVRFGAKIALLGRTTLPRDQWQAILEDAPRGQQARRISALQALETVGVQVLTFTADVRVKAEVLQVVEQVEQTLGQIDGVIHAAGVAGGGVMERRDQDEIDRVIDTKVMGARNLLEIFETRPLRFLALCSSMVSLTGAFGQMDYCAANAVLDAMAWKASRRRNPLTTVSINWDAWRDVGMAVDAGERPDVINSLVDGLEPSEAVAAFEQALSLDAPQVAITQRAWSDLAKQDRTGTPVVAARTTVGVRPALPYDYVAPEGAVESRLAAIWGEFLGVSGVGAQDRFLDLGGHSLLAAQVTARIRADFGVELPIAAIFENETVAGLAFEVEALVIRDIEVNA